jgi:hypothetical protein
MSLPDLTGTDQPGRTAAGAWSSVPGQPATGLPDSRTPGLTESRSADLPTAPAAYAAGSHPQQTEAGRTSTGTEHHTNGAAAPAAVRAPGSRPSPRPRTAPPPSPGPVLDDTITITHGNSPQVSSGDSGSAPGGVPAEENGPEVSSLQSSLQPDVDTLREQIRSGLAGFRAYVTPPSVLTDPPPSVAELRAYVRWGAWTGSTDGPLRNLGLLWHRLFSLPVTVVCRYTEWLWQRPGRLIPIYLLFKLLISTGPGPWVAGHIIRPVLGVVAWVLL